MRWLCLFVMYFMEVHGQPNGYKYGWCVYSFEANSEDHLKIMQAYHDSVVCRVG